jgi:hypothetical protein
MKTIVILEITHSKPITALPNLIAGRAYTIDGVTNSKPVKLATDEVDMSETGFTLRELSLGAGEVVSL